MNKLILRTLFIVVLAVISVPLIAGVYKYVDENGNVVFTDSPPADEKTEEVVLPKVQTIEKFNEPLPRRSSTASKTKPKASVFTVSMSPANGETIRANGGVVAVNAILDPEPDFPIKTNFYLDGSLISSNVGTSGSISNVDRGEHNFQVEVINTKTGATVGLSLIHV